MANVLPNFVFLYFVRNRGKMSVVLFIRAPACCPLAGSNEGPPENMRSVRILENPQVNFKMVQSIKRKI